jgi:hypothetical protein
MTYIANHRNEPSREIEIDALRPLSSIHTPEGMQSRIMERVSQREIKRAAPSVNRYAWEFWTGISIGAVALAAIFGFLALHAHRAAPAPVAAITLHNVLPTTVRSLPATQRTLKPIRVHTAISVALTSSPDVPLQQSPPPLPLTQQECLLLALAGTPALAASAAVTQPVPDHGLGVNSIFELEHEQLTPLQAEPLESTPLSPIPSNPISSGENQ